MALHDYIRTQFLYSKPYSVKNVNDIKRIIYFDNDDGTVFKGAQASKYCFNKTSHAAKNIYDWLAEKIYSYLNNESTETVITFDNWHHIVCDEFVRQSNLAGFCSRIRGGRTFSVVYGLAQKFLNLALKYTYCFEDANTLDIYKKYDFCHVVLDSYTYCPAANSRTSPYYTKYITSITRLHGVVLFKPLYSESINPAISIRSLKPWSKLIYSSAGGFIGYINIQNEIRNFFTLTPITYNHVAALDIHGLARCSPATILTPFQIEFFVW
jgi:hypothetical protein